MELEIEVWLRGQDTAVTDVVDASIAEPSAWTERDIRVLLEELLRAIERATRPDAPRDRPVALRGFSWIVSPFEGGGYTVAVEIQLGASAAGPFDVDRAEIERLIASAMAHDRPGPPGPRQVH